MCNLSDLIEERGMEKGLEKGIEHGTFMTLKGLVEDGILSEAEAAERMKVSVECFRSYDLTI